MGIRLRPRRASWLFILHIKSAITLVTGQQYSVNVKMLKSEIFTTEQVLEEVLSDTYYDETEEDNLSLSEVLVNSLREFQHLRQLIDSLYSFKRKATHALQSVYRRHSVGLLNECEKIIEQSLPFKEIIQAGVNLWLRYIYCFILSFYLVI